MTPQKENIDIDTFGKLDLRVGVIEKAEVHPNGTKLLVLTVYFGAMGRRTICAGIREFFGSDVHQLAKITGLTAVFVVNLPPRMMRGVESQGMILAASNWDHTRLGIVQVVGAIANGDTSDVMRFVGGESVG